MSGYRRSSDSSGSSGQHQYKGVRMRRWGKWVSEIREPQRKKRIWLGSYRSAEEAAHAYDAALLCLRGPTANLNFPNDRPSLPPGSPGNYSTREVQAAAAAAAAASVGRRFSYSEFMSPKSSSDSSDEEVEDITYNRDQSTSYGETSYGETWRPIDDDPYLYPDMARGMLIRPPSYSDNDDSDDNDDDDYNPSLWG